MPGGRKHTPAQIGTILRGVDGGLHQPGGRVGPETSRSETLPRPETQSLKVWVDSGAGEHIVAPTLMKSLRVLLLSLCCLPVFGQDGFVALFNGRDLTGWDAEPGLWNVQDGVIVGTSEVGRPKTNSFLIWKGTVRDFELRVTIRVVGDNNSGIQYRSRRLPEITPWTILGYQCDVHPVDVHTAMTYEERGRGIFGYNGVDVVMDPTGQRWQVGERPRVTADLSQWNEFSVIARGNRMEHRVNGRTTSVFIDHDEKHRALSGLIAIQLHAGTPHKTYVKQILLKTLDDGPVLPFAAAALPAGARKIDKPRVVSAQGKNPPAKKAAAPARK